MITTQRHRSSTVWRFSSHFLCFCSLCSTYSSNYRWQLLESNATHSSKLRTELIFFMSSQYLLLRKMKNLSGVMFCQVVELSLRNLDSCSQQRWLLSVFVLSLSLWVLAVAATAAAALCWVPIIAILTLDFLECHVKRHEEPVKGPRGLTVACIRLWLEFDPSKRLRIILVVESQIGTFKP